MKTILFLIVSWCCGNTFMRWTPPALLQGMGSAHPNSGELTYGDKHRKQRVILTMAQSSGEFLKVTMVLMDQDKVKTHLSILARGDSVDIMMSIDTIDFVSRDGELIKIVGYSKGKEIFSYKPKENPVGDISLNLHRLKFRLEFFNL